MKKSWVGLLLLLAATVFAQHSNGHVMVSPDEIKWNGNTAVLSGDPRKEGAPFVLRLKFADGAKIPPHWHPIDEQVTVISGTFFMGQGEEFDETKAHEMKTGAYGLMPKEVRHFAWVKGETVIQIHGLGPFITNWVKPPAKLTSSAAPHVNSTSRPSRKNSLLQPKSIATSGRPKATK